MSCRGGHSRARREREKAEKPLEAYRAEELERMRLGFYGFDPSYHVPIARTPLHLARHRLPSVPNSTPERS